MKNGGFIRRRFTQIIRRDTPLYEQMNRVYNMPVVRKALVNNYFSVNPDITVENITGDCTELMDLLISFGLADTRADLMYD